MPSRSFWGIQSYILVFEPRFSGFCPLNRHSTWKSSLDTFTTWSLDTFTTFTTVARCPLSIKVSSTGFRLIQWLPSVYQTKIFPPCAVRVMQSTRKTERGRRCSGFIVPVVERGCRAAQTCRFCKSHSPKDNNSQSTSTLWHRSLYYRPFNTSEVRVNKAQ